MAESKSFKVGSAPWEVEAQTRTFKVGEAPWEKTEEPKAKPGVSAVRNFVQGATMNFSDEIAGLTEAAGRAAGVDGVGGPMKDIHLSQDGPTLDWEVLRDAYKRATKKERDALKKDAQDNPKTTFASSLAGALMSPVNKVVPTMSMAKSGATVGALASAGASEGDSIKDVAQDAVTGAVTGAVVGKGLEKAIPFAQRNPTLAGGLGGGAVGALTSDADNAKDFAKDVLSGSAKGAALVKGTKTAIPIAQEGLQKLAKKLEVLPKEQAAKILAAAERLGIKPTAGMTKDSEFVQNLESSLHQSPTIGGALLRRETNNVAKGLDRATSDVLQDASELSKFEVGEQVKKQIASDVSSKFKSSTDTFNDLAQYTKDISSTPRSTQAVSRNIMSIPEVQVLELPIAKQVVRQLEKNPTADQIKTLRTMVGKKAESAVDGAEQSALWQIYHKLGRLEENTIKRGVIDSARTSGEADLIAEGMLGQLKGAKKSYSSQMGKIQDVAENARLGRVKGPGSFVEKIDAIPSENVQDKLLNLADTRLTESIKTNFPESYMTMRAAKLGDLARKSKDAEGNIVTGKLVSNTKSYSPEAKQNLFQNASSKLEDLRIVNGSLPDRIGPSGTPQGLDYLGFLNPVNQARDIGRYAVYKGLTSDKVQAVVRSIKQSPRMQNLIETNPQAARAVVVDLVRRMEKDGSHSIKAADKDPKKGPEKWARDGFDRIVEHDPELENQFTSIKDQLLEDPKSRDLLVRASDLKPGTKAMSNLIQKIKNKQGQQN